ncbi:MAG: anti-sigma factor [Pseudomonadota bacterium]
MTQGREDDDMLAAELVLGLLDGAELQAARDRAAKDAAFVRLVRDWEARLSQMADLSPVDAPQAVKQALMAELFPEAQRPPFWARLGLWQAVAGAAVAVALLFALVLPALEQGPATGPLYTAEIVSEIGDFRVVAVVDKTRDEVILTRTAGAAPTGRILQVWAHGPDEPAESVGLWPEGETIRLALPANIAAVRGTLTLGVSEEPPGGSVTGAPSGRVFGTVDIPDVSAPG